MKNFIPSLNYIYSKIRFLLFRCCFTLSVIQFKIPAFWLHISVHIQHSVLRYLATVCDVIIGDAAERCDTVRVHVLASVRACVSPAAPVRLYLHLLCPRVSVKCPAGQYRVGQSPGTCHDCPAGSYRNLTMENCTWCGDLANWRTECDGKTSVNHCKCEYTLVGRKAVLIAIDHRHVTGS